MPAEIRNLTKGRIFDRAAFSREICEHLDHISDNVYLMRHLSQITIRSPEIATLHLQLKDAGKQHFHLTGDKINSGLSAHQKLSIKSYTASIMKSAQHIAEQITQEAPILAEPDMSLDIVVAPRCRQGAMSRLFFKGMTIGDPCNPTLNAELSDTVALAIERIAGLPAGPRVFRFSYGDHIHARTPEDAYRAYVAIACPDIFERQDLNSALCPQISEVIDAGKCHSALHQD
jgi:hypothetical protein